MLTTITSKINVATVMMRRTRIERYNSNCDTNDMFGDDDDDNDDDGNDEDCDVHDYDKCDDA